MKKAGKIAAQALEYGKQLIKDGAVIVEICDKIEEKINALGGSPAFPVQISTNDTAAHSCPGLNDTKKFNGEIVKLDLGVCINGMIGDNAITVDLSGKYDGMIHAAEKARDEAIKLVIKEFKTVSLAKIGELIEHTIMSLGFQPIRNLSGHGLGEYLVHIPPTIPNHDNGNNNLLTEGVFAVEPFSTTGAGMVVDSEQEPNIFSFNRQGPIRGMFAREVQQFIEKEYKTLPFCTRWLARKFGEGKTRLALKELHRMGAIHGYPPLIEKSKAAVAQSEHTVLITDKVEIITKE